MRVAVVDYGMGNLHSVSKAVEHVAPHARVEVTSDPARVAGADRVVFPGQGAMPDCMRELDARGLRPAVLDAARSRPFLGICIGLQMLFERSDEGGADCLGLLGGGCRRMAWSRKLPHMGWNDAVPAHPHPLAVGLPAVCYFAHSFAVEPSDPSAVVATTELDGRSFPCLVADGRVAGAQFHPERSGRAGRELLVAYLGWADAA